MEGTVVTIFLFTAVLGSIIGGFILMLLARFVGKIETAKYGNSFLVCLFSSLAYFLIAFKLWSSIFSIGFLGSIFINLLLLSACYIVIGKNIWKCDWVKSAKANIVWIIAYTLLLTYFMTGVS